MQNLKINPMQSQPHGPRAASGRGCMQNLKINPMQSDASQIGRAYITSWRTAAARRSVS